MATGYNVRIGDADREAIAAQLREHYADGRLTLDELNERLDQTFAAKVKADLDVVMRDLPHVARPLTDAPAVGLRQHGVAGSGLAGTDGAVRLGLRQRERPPVRACRLRASAGADVGGADLRRGDTVRHRRR